MVIKTNGQHLEMEEILEGFLYSYRQLDTNAVKVYEASAHLYSLIELLVAKGIIGIDELDQRKKVVERRLQDTFKAADVGVRVQRTEVDKYSVQGESRIECEKRLALCRAACCTLTYPLSVQDINEGIRWSLGRPFMNARGSDGYCVHLERGTHQCSIYEHRPSVCRQYDCRIDQRIWLDFDKMVVNPDPFREATPPRIQEMPERKDEGR